MHQNLNLLLDDVRTLAPHNYVEGRYHQASDQNRGSPREDNDGRNLPPNPTPGTTKNVEHHALPINTPVTNTRIPPNPTCSAAGSAGVSI